MSQTNKPNQVYCGLIACNTCKEVNNCSAVTKKDVELMGISDSDKELRDPTGKEMDEFYEKNREENVPNLLQFALTQGEHAVTEKTMTKRLDDAIEALKMLSSIVEELKKDNTNTRETLKVVCDKIEENYNTEQVDIGVLLEKIEKTNQGLFKVEDSMDSLKSFVGQL